MSDDARQLDADILKEIHEYGVDLDNDVVYLDGVGDEDDGEVTAQAARKFVKNLRTLVGAGAERVTVVINSPGGSIQHGMAIYDAIRLSPVPVTGLVYGEASSMASVILQACTKRVAAPHACIMYHAGTHDTFETPFHEAPSAFGYERLLGKQIDDIMWRAALARQPDLDRRTFEVQTMRGIYLTPRQAVEYGFLDEVLVRA